MAIIGKPMTRRDSSPALMTAYRPTLRDKAANIFLRMTGDTYEANRLAENIFGSSGLGATKFSMVDATPLGLPFAADEAGRRMAQGGAANIFSGVADLALAAVPVPGAAKGARRVANRLFPKAYAEAIEAAAKKYKYVGLRTVDEPVIGQMAPSRVWVNGSPTNRSLNGVSTTNAFAQGAPGAHSFAPVDHSRGYYPGDYTYVIGGNRARRGADADELVIEAPEVIFGGPR